MEALADAEGQGDDEAYEQLEAEAEGLQAQRNALEDTLSSFAPEWSAWAGCVVSVGTQGWPEVRRELIRPEDHGWRPGGLYAAVEHAMGRSKILEQLVAWVHANPTRLDIDG